MSHFYLKAKGRGRYPRTCTGTKNTGILVTLSGWNIGLKAEIRHVQGRDVIYLTETRGTRYNNTIKTYLGSLFEETKGLQE